MKKIISLILAFAMCMLFVACTGNGVTTTEPAGTTETPEVSGEVTTGTDETTEAASAGYKVTVTDKDGNPIEGVQIQMCDSGGCRLPKGTGADGSITFDYEESDFHVLIAAAVEGYVVDTTEEYFFENGGKELTIVLEKAN